MSSSAHANNGLLRRHKKTENNTILRRNTVKQQTTKRSHNSVYHRFHCCFKSYSTTSISLLALLFALYNIFLGGSVFNASSSQPNSGRSFWRQLRRRLSNSFSPYSAIYTVDLAIDDSPDKILLPAEPTNNACATTSGILHIAMGDIGGAAGTIFFQFILGQLVYAEMNNLTPWVHLNNVSYIVYDEEVHGRGPGVDLRHFFTGREPKKMSISTSSNRHWRDQYPGPLDKSMKLTRQDTLHFPGTGVWQHYFEPVSSFTPGDKSCEGKLYLTLDLFSITPGIHGFAPWAPRCWRYHYLPEYVTKPHVDFMQWLAPYREIGRRVASKYIKFRPYLYEAAEAVNPGCTGDTLANTCLGLHIRHSDKSAGRRIVQTSEFLPYARAFVHAGGGHIYLATDSTLVIEEILSSWPYEIVQRLRYPPDIMRSSNESAVFDLVTGNTVSSTGSSTRGHHKANIEALTDILALSKCHYLVHGLSAVSEAAIWISKNDLDVQSVNIETDEFQPPASTTNSTGNDESTASLHKSSFVTSPALFGTMVQTVAENSVAWPTVLESVMQHTNSNALSWFSAWYEQSYAATKIISHSSCEGKDGVLLISSVGVDSMAGGAFFTSIMNQLTYAELYNLVPYVHIRKDVANVYDTNVHGSVNVTMEMLFGMGIKWKTVDEKAAAVVPGEPRLRADKLHLRRYLLEGNGVWESYLEPVSAYRPGDMSCRVKPLMAMDEKLVTSGMNTHWSLAVKAWQADNVPSDVWNGKKLSYKDLMQPMRRRGHEIVNKYYKFLPYIYERADMANPIKKGELCLAVHLRNGEKKCKFRRKVKATEYLPYMEAFVKAGGTSIYLSSDSQKAIQYIERNFAAPEGVTVRYQSNVVRTFKEYPIHSIADHHRVNSELLVDIVAMSKCRILLHSHSTTSEAVIYMNPDLHVKSVNLEDSGKISPVELEKLVKDEQSKSIYVASKPGVVKTVEEDTIVSPIIQESFNNVTINYRTCHKTCHRNAIVYLAQKTHSSYGRDSESHLMHSLDLLYKNYLSIGNHANDVDIFIFHTGDFTEDDISKIESRFGDVPCKISIKLLDLSLSSYWARPSTLERDDLAMWHAYPLFSEGYRKMMSWFAVEIWDFFQAYRKHTDCKYKYIMRLDEDSYIHSPIQYDIFEYMSTHDYVYGYRMCSYEMRKARFVWNAWSKRHNDFAPLRQITPTSCGFYNNFFVAEIDFFLKSSVRIFLHSIRRQGVIYRRRLGDLLIHTMTVYAFAEERQVHRFLDFTYEHGTYNQTTGCLEWGGIQAGYKDSNAVALMQTYYQEKLIDRNCSARATFLSAPDLSPTYAHFSESSDGSEVLLYTITAGEVELSNMGEESG